MVKDYKRRTVKDFNLGLKLFQQAFVACAVWPVALLQYNFKYEGRENLEKGKQYIFCPNHVSYLDPPFTAAATGFVMSFMAKQELFFDKNRLLRWLVIHLGAFAVNREKPELSTFKTIKDVFAAKWSLGIFPQGRICEGNKLSDVHKGFAAISKQFKIDVVPIAVCGYDGYANKLFEKHMTIKIGKPIPHELSEQEIIDAWKTSVCEMAGYERVTEFDNLQSV